MKNLSNRLELLENQHTPEELPVLEIAYIESRDQVHNPDKYDRILVSEETSESGLTRREFRLEPKPGYSTPADSMEINKD